MSRNRLSDLHDHLFDQLDRLAVASAEQLDAEVTRAEAIVAIADQITANADTQLRAAKLFAEHGAPVLSFLPAIGGKPEGKP